MKLGIMVEDLPPKPSLEGPRIFPMDDTYKRRGGGLEVDKFDFFDIFREEIAVLYNEISQIKMVLS